jgi:hypothetical protein
VKKLAALALLAACASQRPRWADPALPPPDRFPDAPAVALYRHRELVLLSEGSGPSTQQRFHEVVLVRAEKGIDLAEVRIPVLPGESLEELRARIRGPDGAAREVPRSAMLELPVEVGGEAGGFRVFRFPDVRVGSVLEVVWAVRVPWLLWYERQSSFARIPVLRYELDVSFNGAVALEVATYNSATAIRKTRDSGLGLTRLHWQAEDTPAREEEEYGPHWTQSEPWWAFRVARFAVRGRVHNANLDWGTASRPWRERVYEDDGKLWAGFGNRIDTAGCAGRRCLLDRAVEFVTSRTEFDGFGTFGTVRPLAEVLAGERASAFEQAILLQRLLSDAGVEARLAALVRPLTSAWDSEVPTMSYFNHLIVYVPLQAELQETWIDPSCAHCRPGELPFWSQGEKALILHPDKWFFGSAALGAEFRDTGGAAAPPEEDLRSFRVRLEANGDASIDVSLEQRGTEAVSLRRRTRSWTADDWAKADREFVSSRAPNAEIASASPARCDKRTGSCVRTLSFRAPGFATVDGDKLLVPLSLLSTSYDRAFKKEQRRDHVTLPAPDRTEERIAFEVPGYRLSAPPPPRSVNSAAFTTLLQVRATESGAGVVRSIEAHMGTYAKSSYAPLRKIVRDYAETREQLLVFTKKR